MFKACVLKAGDLCKLASLNVEIFDELYRVDVVPNDIVLLIDNNIYLQNFNGSYSYVSFSTLKKAYEYYDTNTHIMTFEPLIKILINDKIRYAHHHDIIITL